MSEETKGPLSGRRAEAARNDELIREAARAVFLEDPGAPISAVAERAGVGIGALYRRYRSKDELLQRLAADGLRRYVAGVEVALADDGDPWDVFARFMRASLDAGAHWVSARFAGSFPVTEEMNRNGRRAYEATQQLLDRAKSAGALRPDIEVGDISLLFEQLQAVQIRDPRRTAELRHRYLALILEALRNDSSADPLPGPPPSWQEIAGRYES